MLTLLLALLTLSGLLVWQGYRDVMSTAHARAEGAAQIVGANVGWMVEAAQQSLRRIDERLGSRPDIFLASSVGDLDEAVSALPVEVGAWVIDPNGRSILTNEPLSESIGISDREYFQRLKSGEEWVISPLLRGRSSERLVFVIGRRIERDGNFLGAAVVVIPATLLSDFWSTMNLGPQSTASLVRSDGWLVSRHPAVTESFNLSEHILFTENLAHRPAGSYVAASPADGVERIVGFYSIPGLPLISVAGISKDAIIAQFWSRASKAAVVGVPAALALLGVAVWVGVLLRRYEEQRAALATALEQNNVLLREIHHRVKNNLQTVASLIRLQDIPPEMKKEVTNRIVAMTAVHEQLYLSNNFGELDLAAYVTDLVGKLKDSNTASVTVTQSLEQIEVDPERAIPLGLVINEVVQNAFKHAFPEGRSGNIAITLERIAADTARLVIRDDGTGFDPDIATGTNNAGGMGSRLVVALSRQIGAMTDYTQEGGTTFTMTFPLRRREALAA